MPPEAIVPFLILVVAVCVYLGARANVANAESRDALTRLPRLRAHRSWLEERLQLANKENWDAEMRARILEEIETIDRQLASHGVAQATDAEDAQKVR